MKRYYQSYSPQFWLMCLASFLFFASFNMVLPELPDYLVSLGGGQYKWLYILSFSAIALLSRPFSGKLSDTIGRMPVMLFGAFICLVTGCLYPFVNTVAFFFTLRMVHGFSAGFTPTGSTAYVADSVALERRGEAMGLIGITNNIGMSLGPALGSYITMKLSLVVMFATSAAFAAASLVIFMQMKETLQDKQPFTLSLLSITRKDFYEPRVWLPSLVMVLTVVCIGVVLTVYPDMSKHLGIKNKGIFVTITTLSSITMRFGAGRLSDRIGRRVVAFWGCIILALGMVCLALTQSVFMFVFSGILYGVAFGILSPTLFAWAADLASSDNKGRAVSTLFMALELGVISGCGLTGLIYDDTFASLSTAFWICVCSVGIAIVLLYLNKRYETLSS